MTTSKELLPRELLSGVGPTDRCQLLSYRRPLLRLSLLERAVSSAVHISRTSKPPFFWH